MSNFTLTGNLIHILAEFIVNFHKIVHFKLIYFNNY
ncbi:hypothetical protein M2451_000562 [Dysgonomonas sp. PFB1-18]|nr:hypothetical protein [Dysgonomonas sp. PF1-14]MDH6337331.1 hypothetical protein [Dysgonomonas sp. PF1-16]MDH6379255.1 hypothetical protein [Dysgonomonas sp. PFB1-18]MDH6396107.1 hypothetical protein [Dysgonomonas sp. PF1-23]